MSWENEKRAVYRTAEGKLLYMCQERADIMYSVKETARKIFVPQRTTRLKGVRSAKCLVGIITLPQSVNVYTDSDWAGQPMICKNTSGGVVQ